MPRKKQKLSDWVGPSRWQEELRAILDACDSPKATPAHADEERVLPRLIADGLIVPVCLDAVEAWRQNKHYHLHYETTQRGRRILAMLRAA